MKRRRYIPLKIRVLVVERQIAEKVGLQEWERMALAVFNTSSFKARLADGLKMLFGDKAVELHHRPALVNRPLNRRKTDTVPPANSPDHMVYLLKDEEHRIETYVRGVGAQRSDVSQRRYLKRVEKNRQKKKRSAQKWPSAKIPKRVEPWGSGSRKLRWRR